MATQLFKGSESVFVDTKKVRHYIEAGWSPDDPKAPKSAHPDVIYPPSMKLESLSQAEAEKVVLEAMGIAAVEPARQKRKYTKKAK
jgi:hypothetical protein